MTTTNMTMVMVNHGRSATPVSRAVTKKTVRLSASSADSPLLQQGVRFVPRFGIAALAASALLSAPLVSPLSAEALEVKSFPSLFGNSGDVGKSATKLSAYEEMLAAAKKANEGNEEIKLRETTLECPEGFVLKAEKSSAKVYCAKFGEGGDEEETAAKVDTNALGMRSGDDVQTSASGQTIITFDGDAAPTLDLSG